MNLFRLKLGTLAAACLLSCAVMAADGGGTSGGVKAPITAITTPISNFVPPESGGYGFNFVPLALTAGATEQTNPGDVHLLSNTGQLL